MKRKSFSAIVSLAADVGRTKVSASTSVVNSHGIILLLFIVREEKRIKIHHET